MYDFEILLWAITHDIHVEKVKEGYSVEVYHQYKNQEESKLEVYVGKTLKECIKKAIDNE